MVETEARRASLEHEAGHALLAQLFGFGVGTVTAIPDEARNACTTVQTPGRRDPLRAWLELTQIVLAGNATRDTGRGAPDEQMANEYARKVAFSDEEAELLLNWLEHRTRWICDRPQFREACDHLVARLEAAGGALDLDVAAARDAGAPLFELRQPDINVVVNLPEQPPPVVQVDNVVEVPPPADKQIAFKRDGAGKIVSASSKDKA